jgi:hypothetical protein
MKRASAGSSDPQVPLSFEFTTGPAGRIRATRVYQDHPGAWIAQVDPAPFHRGERILLDWTSVVLVGHRSPGRFISDPMP